MALRCARDAKGERVLGREERSRVFFVSTSALGGVASGSFDTRTRHTRARARIVVVVAAATHHPRARCRGRGGYV